MLIFGGVRVKQLLFPSVVSNRDFPWLCSLVGVYPIIPASLRLFKMLIQFLKSKQRFKKLKETLGRLVTVCYCYLFPLFRSTVYERVNSYVKTQGYTSKLALQPWGPPQLTGANRSFQKSTVNILAIKC